MMHPSREAFGSIPGLVKSVTVDNASPPLQRFYAAKGPSRVDGSRHS